MTFKQRIDAFLGREQRSTTIGLAEWFYNDPQYCASGYRRLYDTPEVMACVNTIASMVSNMTIHLMRNTSKGDVRIHDGLSRKIDIEPYGNMTRKQWIEWIVKTMLIHGNAFVYPSYNGDLIEDLNLVPSKDVKIESKGFKYKVKIGDKYINPDELLHFVYNVNIERPFEGRGLQVELRDVMKTLKFANDTRISFMKSEFRPSVIISVEGLVDEFSDDEGKEEIKRKIGANIQPGEPFVVPAGMVKVDQVRPLTLEEIAIADGIELDKRLVAALFGVPVYYMGIGDFNPEEHNNFVKTTIRNISETIAQVLTKGLILSPDRYFRLNPRSLLAFSISEITALGKELGSIGFVVGNEIRDDLGFPPLEGLDKPIVLENYIPIDKIGDQEKLGGANE